MKHFEIARIKLEDLIVTLDGSVDIAKLLILDAGRLDVELACEDRIVLLLRDLRQEGNERREAIVLERHHLEARERVRMVRRCFERLGIGIERSVDIADLVRIDLCNLRQEFQPLFGIACPGGAHAKCADKRLVRALKLVDRLENLCCERTDLGILEQPFERDACAFVLGRAGDDEAV